MKTIHLTHLFRWLPAAVAAVMLAGGCLNPAPRQPPTPVAAGPEAEALFPTQTLPPTLEAPTAFPASASTFTPLSSPPPAPSEEPAAPVDLQLQSGGKPEDVKEIIQQMSHPPTGGGQVKLVLPGDAICYEDLKLMQVARMAWQGWVAGSDVLVTVFSPGGEVWQEVFPASPQGEILVNFQAVIGQPVGSYSFVLDNGQERRDCSLQYQPVELRPGLYLLPANPFTPAFAPDGSSQALLLYGFAPGELARLLVYQPGGESGVHSFRLMGWQDVQAGADGRLRIALSEGQPQDLKYVAVGQWAGEVHLSLPSPVSGEFYDSLEFETVLEP